jgi:uncharacterized membrane protein YeaQ/YmgE (transglycosylase-associated protein family)
MELFAWLAIGLLPGVAASLAARRGQAGRLATVAAGAGAAVVTLVSLQRTSALSSLR